MLLILVTISCVFLNGISAFWFNNGQTTEVPSNISTPIRLVGGNYPWEGRVEIEYNGRWGTICDDMFDINDTAVLCRMLGHNDTDGSIEYYSRAHFGGGYGPILIDDLDCSGEEDDVSECKSTAWFTNNCNHGEDVSVNCAAGTKVTFGQYFQRDAPDDLLGRRGKVSFHITYDYEGYLEIFFERRWGYVCYNNTQHAHQFDFVCQSLGFSSVYNISSKTAVRHAIVTDFNCPSYSHSNGVNDCTGRNLGAHTYCMFMLYIRCDHSTTVAPFIKPSYTESLTTEGTVTRPLDSGNEITTVQYFERATTAEVLGRHGHLSFRLTNGSYGLLEIYYKGRLGYVCHNYNQQRDQFHSACRYLGYSSAYRVYGQYDSSHYAIVTDFHCPRSYFYYSSNGIDDCTGSRLGYTDYCNDKLYIECDSVTTEETATVPFKTGPTTEVPSNTSTRPTTEVPSNTSTPIRLVGGRYPWEGRVEILYNGQWGTICDDMFDINDTTVVCRMLGYNDTDGSIVYYRSAHFGRGYGPILIDDLDCSGEEDDVSECNRTPWFQSNCDHSEDVSVKCDHMQDVFVRLVNGQSSLEGRVEINVNGSWGTICDDLFGVPEAAVICGMLGYSKAGSIPYSKAHFGSGYGQPIVLDDLQCIGTETSILDCQSSGLFHDNCGHTEDAGVACKDLITTEESVTKPSYSDMTSYTSTQVRLVGGYFNWEGRVEVYHEGQWGTICDDQFDRQDAQVICSMLGYSRYGSVTSYGSARFGGGSGSIMLDNLECSGYETDIAQCKSNGWYQNDCTHIEDASISCAYPTSYYESSTYQYNMTTSDTLGGYGHISIRLTAGNRGSLMLYYNGRWGYVCYNSNQYAHQFNSVCRSLGYSSANSISQYYESRPAIVTDFHCPGYYYSNGVDDCTGRNFGSNTYCNYKLYIECDSLTTEESVTKPLYSVETSASYTNVRLVGGNYYWEGRVEIYHNGAWGTICDDDFDTNEAKVICAMLGYNRYGSVTAYGNAAFGEGYGSIMLDDLRCNGYESDISHCLSNGWNNHNCGHSEDASVSCRYPKSVGRTEVTTAQYFDRYTTANVLGRYGHLSFRLTNDSEGYLQIYYNGQWGYVCHNYNQYATHFHSACRYLGYSSAYSVYGRYDRSHTAIVTDFNCPSSYYYYSSNGIDDCTGNRLGYTNYCNDKLYIECNFDASTVGYEVTTADKLGSHGHIPVRLTYGGEGYLQIYYNGRWGYVCHKSGQSKNKFNSVCRNLGYSSARSVYGRYGNSHTALVTNLQCPGSYYYSSSGSYYYYSSSNGIDDCTGDRLGYNTYCNDKLYIACDSVTTEETATVPFKTGCQSVTSSPADVIFVVDESGSVGSDNFDRTRASIVDTIRHLDIRNDFIRIGVMTFDDNSRTVFNLNSYPGDPNSMVNRVMSMSYSSGGTDIADALSHACSNMFTSFNGDRSNATNYLVLLTDGQSRAQQEADRCKASGTKIISVGIGDSIDEKVLRNLSYNYDYYLSTNYSDIAGFLPKLVTTAVNCGGLESTNAKHITVNCQHSSWYVKVHLPPMEQQYSDFKETDIYLGSHSCTGTRSGDYLIFNEDYTTCGTNKIASSNGVIYTNTLVYAVHDPNQPYIVHEYRFRVSVECDMSKQESGENNINNNHGNLEQQTISGVGHFVVQLKFFSDSNFQHEFKGFPPSYMVGQNVYVKATTPIHDYNVKMRLSDCYTKPSKSASDSYIYYLIQNGCPAAPSAFVTTKSTHETRFHFQDFEYAFHPDSMYVHCNATFCQSNDYSRDCEPRCSNRKRVGSIDQDDEPIEGVGPIGYAEDEATVFFQKGSEALNAGKKPEVENKGNKPLYIVGVVVVAVAMVAILVVMSIYFRSKRRQNGQSKIV